LLGGVCVSQQILPSPGSTAQEGDSLMTPNSEYHGPGIRTLSDVGAVVIGTGFVGTVHVEQLRRIGVQVRGILEITPERGEVKAKALGVPRAYPSLEAVLADPSVDIVHVTSPNYLHVEQSKQILTAGKHVICEKPLAMTSADSATVVALAAETGLVNAVNFNLRFYPLHQHVRELIEEGGLGDTRFITGHYHQDWLLYDTDWSWRLDTSENGPLRAVADIGMHWLDLTTFLVGQPVISIMADMTNFISTRFEPRGAVEAFSTVRSTDTVARKVTTEDVASIMLRFANGARGALTLSQISAGRKNSLQWEIDGSVAAAAWDSETPDHLWIGHRDRANEVLLRNPALMNAAGRQAAALPGGHVEGFGDTFGAVFRAVYADVLAGHPSERPPYATFADGHYQMLLGEAVAESSRMGRWVDVPVATKAAR
jgi:predicted dehydrogenase